MDKTEEVKKFEKELVAIDNEYAEKYYEERLNEDKNNAEYNYELARVKWRRSKIEEAEKYFKIAIELDSSK